MEGGRIAGCPPGIMGRAREWLRGVEGYKLVVSVDEFAARKAKRATAVAAGSESAATDTSVALSNAATRAARRRIAAQNSLFDLANQRVVDELRSADVEKLSDAEAKALLAEIKKKLI